MRSLATPVARRPMTPPTGGRQVAQVVTRPPPVGGWNARDSLALMPIGDAVTLDNIFPGETLCSLRRGYTSHATGMGTGSVETVAEYHVGTTQRLIAAANGNIYNATGAGSASSLASGFSSNRWQWAMMNTSMALCNGVDAVQEYDGSTVGALTISGPTSANVIGVNIFKSRSYFWEVNSQDFWYSDVNALGGTLTQFPLNRVGSFGGNLIAMGTWTLDAGSGVDDLAVFLMSSGEVIVYAGSNPGDAGDWSLIGVFRIASPLDIRSAIKYGPDLIVMTREGFLKLGGVLTQGRINIKAGNLSDKIVNQVVQVATDFANNDGWQALLYPAGNRLIFNVPISSDTFHQYVQNTVTGAWCRFKGMPAAAWGLYDDELYFGGTAGVLYKADDGNDDAGAEIEGLAETAYDYMGANGVLKNCVGLQLYAAASANVTYGLAAQADFAGRTVPTGTYMLASTAPAAAVDYFENITDNFEDCEIIMQSGAPSAGDIQHKWITASAEGYAIGARLHISLTEQFDWHAIQYMIKAGGIVT